MIASRFLYSRQKRGRRTHHSSSSKMTTVMMTQISTSSREGGGSEEEERMNGQEKPRDGRQNDDVVVLVVLHGATESFRAATEGDGAEKLVLGTLSVLCFINWCKRCRRTLGVNQPGRGLKHRCNRCAKKDARVKCNRCKKAWYCSKSVGKLRLS